MAKKTRDDDEREIFSKERLDLGIVAAFDAFEKLDMTLFECWYAAHVIETVTRVELGEKFEELAEKYPEQLGIESPKAP